MNHENHKKILLTFDYELFLGQRSGTVQKCLIKPTDHILQLLREFKLRHSIFFVDTIYLLLLKKYQNVFVQVNNDFIRISEQISKIVNEGHYVFPHLHPHWLDARYNSRLNQWDLNNVSRYRFHMLSRNQQQDVFKSSLQILSEIINPLQPNYKIDSFRAGGWSIQPFSDFIPFFMKYDIVNDFSVVPGKCSYTDAQYYDFRSVKQHQVYTFSDNVTESEEAGRFVEYPISIIRLPLHIDKMCHFYQLVNHNKRILSIGDGRGVTPHNDQNKYSGGNYEILSNMHTRYELLSMDFINKYKLKSYCNFIDSHDYIHFLSHPKMISNHAFGVFERILKCIRKYPHLITDFRKMNKNKAEFVDTMHMN